ncbi:MAG TPA: MFS transporter [Gaiellales bacterium]|jgi:MFS family permease|nr:MFS transporter [Gaiellales bacterium]
MLQSRLPTARAHGRRPERSGRPFLIVGGGWLILMAGANVATPLYAVYAQRFAFSSLELTTIFATYAAVLVPALIIFGRLSDRLGRRPVIGTGLAVAALALILFAAAGSPAWLYGARALQGLAVGMISGAATAALVELEPGGDPRRAAMYAGLAQAGGSALGPLAAGILAQWAPQPLRVPFLALLAATIAAGALTLRVPEAESFQPRPWRLQLPAVPAGILRPFARVSLTAAIVWAVLALYLSVIPSYASDLLNTGDLALLAAIAALAPGTSAVVQILLRRRPTDLRRAQCAGLTVLAVSLVVLIAASPAHSVALLFAGSLAAGAGHGAAFLNAQEELNRVAPGDRRGEVTAAFIACIYVLVGTSVVGVGVLDSWASLAVAVGIVSALLLALAVVAALWQLAAASARRPPTSSPAPARSRRTP